MTEIAAARTRNIGIDLLRTISVLYIVAFWHLLNYVTISRYYANIVTYRTTWIVLAVFTFISGYYVGKRRIELNRQSLISFYTNRVLRIYPLYFLAVIMFLALGICGQKTALKAVLMLSMFVKPAPPTLWFITMIIVFYMVSPFLIIGCKKENRAYLLLSCILACIFLLLYHNISGLLDIRLIVYFPSFVLGIFIANTESRFLEKKHIFFPALILGLVISFLSSGPDRELNWLLSILMITLLSFYFFDIMKNCDISSPKVVKIISVLSYSSYCMYLFHRPIYTFIKRIYFPDFFASKLLFMLAFCLPCLLIFSYFSQKLYDIILQSIIVRFDKKAG